MQSAKVSAFLDAIGKELTAVDVDTHFEGCIGCGNCGHACNWFNTGGMVEMHPKNRSDMLRKIYSKHFTPTGRILRLLGLTEEVTEQDLEKLVQAFYHCCTMCGRCSLACPQGVSTRRITQLARHGLSAAGMMPEAIRNIRQNALSTGHTFGMNYEESVGQAVQMARSQGIEVPVDEPNADYLLGCSAILNSRFPEIMVEGFRLLNAAGVNFTLSSKVIDTGTEVMTTVGDLTLGKKFVTALAQEASRLNVKGVLIGECGCDMRTFLVDSYEVLGKYDIEPVYIDALLLQAAKNGRLPLQKLDMRVTYHDPCWSGRLTGYFEEARELLGMCVNKVVEMNPNREMNICCSGGAGSMRIYPSTDEGMNMRRRASKIKAAQLAQTSVDCVVSPCTTCWLSLDDTVKCYGLPMRSIMLAEIIAKAHEAAISGRLRNSFAEVM